MTDARYLTGQFLLAMPGIGDPRFEQAVVAMCVHDDRGALGIGIGAAMQQFGLHALLAQLEIEPGHAPDVPIHLGGPVEPQRGFVLHSQDWQDEDTLLVADRWALSSTLEVLRAIAAGEGPTRFIVSVGYAGWGAGQLDEEMTRHGWFVSEGSDALLYDVPASGRWERGFVDAGVDVRMLAPNTGTA